MQKNVKQRSAMTFDLVLINLSYEFVKYVYKTCVTFQSCPKKIFLRDECFNFLFVFILNS